MTGRAGDTGTMKAFLDAVPGVLLGTAVPLLLNPTDSGALLRSLVLLAAIGVLYALGRRVLARRERRQPEGVPSPDSEGRDELPEGDQRTAIGQAPVTSEGATARRSVLLVLLTVAVLLLALAVLVAGVSLGMAVAVVAWLLLLVLAARWARGVSDAVRDVLVNVAVVSVGGALAIGGVPVIERVAFEVRPPSPPEDARAYEITTFDGAIYSLRAVGDFVVAELPQADMEVQGRLEARTDAGQRHILLTALAVRRGGDHIAIRAGLEPQLRVNDRPLALVDGSAPVPGGATVERTGKRYRMTWTDLAELSVNAEESDSLDFEFRIMAPEQQRGPVRGLLGNADGDRRNDLSTPQGRVFQQPTEGDAASQARIDGAFADSWRVPLGTRRLLD